MIGRWSERGFANRVVERAERNRSFVIRPSQLATSMGVISLIALPNERTWTCSWLYSLAGDLANQRGITRLVSKVERPAVGTNVGRLSRLCCDLSKVISVNYHCPNASSLSSLDGIPFRCDGPVPHILRNGCSEMSAFVDGTLLRFMQDTFVADLLTNGVGLATIFNVAFEATDVQLQSITLGQISPRYYKVPAFETVRSSGTDERIVPDTQRVRKERVLPRFGRLDWVDVAFEVVLNTKVQILVAPLQSVTVETLEQRLGGTTSIADLRTKLLTLYPPSVVDAIFAKLRITTLDDFERQHHLFVELVGAAPPPFDPNDPASQRDYTVSMRVKIADGFDVAGALQSAKLCRSILEHEAIPDSPDGVNRIIPYVFVTLFADSAVTDTSLPGQTATQAKAAVKALFNAERMFAQFIT